MAILLNNSIIYYDDTRKLVFKAYHGPFTLYDLTASWEQAIKHNFIPEKHNGFIIDCRLGDSQIQVSQIGEITKFYDTYPEIFKGVKMAIISSEPKDYVIPILIGEKKPEYKSKPFSTMDSAVEWIVNGGGYYFFGLNLLTYIIH